MRENRMFYILKMAKLLKTKDFDKGLCIIVWGRKDY